MHIQSGDEPAYQQLVTEMSADLTLNPRRATDVAANSQSKSPIEPLETDEAINGHKIE